MPIGHFQFFSMIFIFVIGNFLSLYKLWMFEWPFFMRLWSLAILIIAVCLSFCLLQKNLFQSAITLNQVILGMLWSVMKVQYLECMYGSHCLKFNPIWNSISAELFSYIYTPSVFCYDKHTCIYKKNFDIQFSMKRHETV